MKLPGQALNPAWLHCIFAYRVTVQPLIYPNSLSVSGLMKLTHSLYHSLITQTVLIVSDFVSVYTSVGV